MSEQDRGAYTPNSEEPLAFDPRNPREGRPIPMTLVGSAVVLAVLVGAVALIYHHNAGGGATRTVGAPVAAIKTVAAPSAQPQDPAATLDVYGPRNVSAQPTFAPTPEQPAPRAAPPRVQVQAAPPPPNVRVETPPAPGAPATVTTTTTRTEVAPAPATAPAAGPAATVISRGAADADALKAPPAAAPRRAPVKPETSVATTRAANATLDAALARSQAAPKSTPKSAVSLVAAPATAHGKAMVQIGAFSSAAIADTQYNALAASVGGMGGHGKAVTPVTVNGKTLYRTSVTGFADKAAAQAFCAKLSAAGRSCIVKG